MAKPANNAGHPLTQIAGHPEQDGLSIRNTYETSTDEEDSSKIFSKYLVKSSRYKGYHYSVLSDEMISYLHNKTLEITKEIINVFENNHIRYMICGGTLLGAVTTNKFIPWDDDVDICVLEDDYEKMKFCLIENLPDWIEVQCEETEPNYYHGWIKVRDKNSTVYPLEQHYKCNGVWVDLYKLSLVNQKDIQQIICKEHLNYLIKRFLKGCISKQDLISRIEGNNLLDRIEKNLQESKETSTQKSYLIMSASKIAVDPNSCFPAKKYAFEGLVLDGFNNADKYLQCHYGNNYRTLPPEELRRVGIFKIDF